jgi:MscS family membrane protein
MKKFLILSLLLFSYTLYGDDMITKYVKDQSTIYAKIDDLNASEVRIKALQNESESQEKDFFNEIMSDREKALSILLPHQTDQKTLEEAIKKDKQGGKEDILHRDMVRLKYYQSLENFYKLIHGVLIATYMKDKEGFDEEIDRVILENKNAMEIDEDITKPRENVIYDDESILSDINKYGDKLKYLVKINNDMRKYILTYQDTIYKSEIYSTFWLSSMSEWIGDSKVSKHLDPLLEYIGLNTTKFVMILLIIFWSILLSSAYYWIVSVLLKYFKFGTDDALYIVKRLQTVIRLFIIVFGIDMISDIYLGVGANVDESRKFFIMTYIALFTYLVHKIIYTISVIKINALKTKERSYRSEIINLAVKLINFIVFLIGFLLILKTYGVELTAILSGLGIGSLAIAFAARDTLANFLGSISILLDNPFSQGDWIQVGSDEGTVVEIGIRSTTIRTFDNALISIPNLTVANNSVKNWSKRLIGRRIKMYLGVTYDSNFNDIKKAIGEIETMLLEHPQIASHKTQYSGKQDKSLRLISKEDARGVKNTLLVYLDSFGDSSINIMVYCFSKSVNWVDWLEVKQDVMFKIAEIFEANNLEFAFPSMSLYMSESNETKKIEGLEEKL